MSTEPLTSLDKHIDFGNKVILGSIGLSFGAVILGSMVMLIYVGGRDLLNEYEHLRKEQELTRTQILNTNNLPHYLEYRGTRYVPEHRE